MFIGRIQTEHLTVQHPSDSALALLTTVLAMPRKLVGGAASLRIPAWLQSQSTINYEPQVLHRHRGLGKVRRNDNALRMRRPPEAEGLFRIVLGGAERLRLTLFHLCMAGKNAQS
jgi:hypothetical protein